MIRIAVTVARSGGRSLPVSRTLQASNYRDFPWLAVLPLLLRTRRSLKAN